MTGSFEDLQAEPGKSRVSPSFIGSEFVLGLAAEPRWIVGPHAVAEFEMAGDEIGVEVSEENVADVERCSAAKRCIGRCRVGGR